MPTNCGSYYAGHNIHWIPVTRAWLHLERHQITAITPNDDDTFTVEYNGLTKVRHYHDPKYFRAILREYPAEQWLAVADTGAIQTKGQPSYWIHLSAAPVPNCADAYLKEIHDNYDKAVIRTKQLIAIKEPPEVSRRATEFLAHLEYIKTLKFWDGHTISMDVSGNPTCKCVIDDFF